MASKSPDKGCMILRPERARLIDILSLLFLRRSLTSYGFVETSGSTVLDLENVRADWVTAITIAIQKFLASISAPMKMLGMFLEFILNLFSLNGGIFGLLWNLIKGSLIIPDREAANFRTFIGHIDKRIDLYSSKSLIHYIPLQDIETGMSDINLLDLCMMASKIAYENAAYITNAVNEHWKMNFVGFYSCWNRFLNDNTTQAFIFCNKSQDADVIILAFRGTEPFNANDWSTDVDLSWLSMGKLGNVHMGFLKALGLQDEKDYKKGFPKEFNGDPTKQVAYYTLREELRALLKKHKNAKLVVTGHSLGGALATIFPALLAMHDQSDIMSSLYAIMTYGQPRVGDATFGSFLQSFTTSDYYRMVYRFDIVPRIPFDFPPIALFKHSGVCVYFNGWYERKIMEDAPNKNYIDPKYIPLMYWYAWVDLFKAFFIRWTAGKDYQESFVSLVYRAFGLIIPGIACHSPRDYVNGGRLSKNASKQV
ncbi:triacylglycerol lipase OBL1-like [Typha latifolia]|uniref:triacylglycerol lipase OBL1-like n=1 Tax=Typha latifolia TaxID=4733 RepID=UPI003C2C15B8